MRVPRTAAVRRRPIFRRKLLILLAVAAIPPLAGLVIHAFSPDGSTDMAARLEAAAPVPSSRLALCVDGPEFMATVERDLAAARERALVQTLSFEADAAGYALAAALVASPAERKRLLVDAFSLYVVSDRFLYDPTCWLDVPLGEEARATLRLLEHLCAHGVDVTIGRPYGPGEDNLAARDHKKIVVIDDAAYVGGINFSEHNFAWHDLMLRVEDPDVADLLAEDMRRSRNGEAVVSRTTVPGLEIVAGRGGGATDIRDRVLSGIDAARERIYLECPYVTEPYFERLGAARARGVDVVVVVPERINRLGLKQSIMDACRRHDLDLRLRPGEMTHLKAMLVDGKTLFTGSANFDMLSATLQPEVLAVTDDPALVAAFATRVQRPGMAASWDWPEDRSNVVIGGVCSGMISLAGDLLRWLHVRPD